MKTLSTCLALSLVLASAPRTYAWFKVGGVFCDANNNGVLDAEDVPVPGVLIVVTNTSGTFSNANWSGSDGLFVVQLPNSPDSFGDFIHPLTLPPGTTEVIPPFSTFSTTEAQPIVTNNFLIRNPNCVTQPPPPPPGRCWLTGGGTIEKRKGQPTFSFGGVVNPGCSPTAAGGGNWNVIWHAADMHFKGLDIEVIGCGNLPGVPPGSTSPKTDFNFIDFEGVGTLKPKGGKKVPVQFIARAVDLGEPGTSDQLYLRVFNEAGQTLLLISADPSNPTVVAPITISTGNLQLHDSGCDK